MNATNETTQLVNDFYRFWETADERLLEKTVSREVIDHDKDPRFEGSAYEGLLYLAKAVQGLSEMKHTLTQVHDLGEGKYMVRWEASANHTSDLFGVPASNKTVYFAGHDIFRIENGKILELWHIEQLLQLMAQVQG